MNFPNYTQAGPEQQGAWQPPWQNQPPNQPPNPQVGAGSPFGNPAYGGGAPGAQAPSTPPGSANSMQSILDLIKSMGQQSGNQTGQPPGGATQMPTPPQNAAAPTLQQLMAGIAPSNTGETVNGQFVPSMLGNMFKFRSDADQQTAALNNQYGWHAGNTAAYGAAAGPIGSPPPAPPAASGLTWAHDGASNKYVLVPTGSDQSRKEAMQWPGATGYTPQAIADKRAEDANLAAAANTQRKLGLMMPKTGWTKSQLEDLATGRNPMATPPKTPAKVFR